MTPAGNTILITGGGSGIGRAMAHRFHDLGNTVIVAGRRSESLVETAAGRDGIDTAIFDIDDRQSIARFARNIVDRHPSLNILINNAGIMRSEDLTAHRDLAVFDSMMATNLLGPVYLTNAFIDHLRTREDAAIVNVSSGLAFVPLVSAPAYSATKAAIHSYSISLREQLRGQVEVIELVPPAVQTGLTPGQETREGFLPLEGFIDEVMALFQMQPTPEEILVERVMFQRNADRENRFEEALGRANPTAR